MATMTRGAQLEKELEEAAKLFSDDNEETEEGDDSAVVEVPVREDAPQVSEPEASPVAPAPPYRELPMYREGPKDEKGAEIGYARYESQLRQKVEARIETYRARLSRKAEEYAVAQYAAMTAKLDAYAMKVGDLTRISDPVKAKETIQRQIATHQATLDNLQKQLGTIK